MKLLGAHVACHLKWVRFSFIFAFSCIALGFLQEAGAQEDFREAKQSTEVGKEQGSAQSTMVSVPLPGPSPAGGLPLPVSIRNVGAASYGALGIGWDVT